MEKPNNKSKLSIALTLLLYALIPLTVSILTFTIYNSITMKNELTTSTYERLKACAVQVKEYFEWDIREDILERDDVSEKYIDSLKDQDIELTLFEKDTRWLTSVKKEDGTRNNDTKCDPKVWETIQAGKDFKADKIKINGENYYTYYTPVYDDNGEVWGMAFAGEKQQTVQAAITKVIRTSVIIAVALFAVFIVLALMICRLIYNPMKAAANELEKISKGQVSGGFNAKSHIKEIVTIVDCIYSVKTNLSDMTGKIKNEMNGLNGTVNTVSGAVKISNDAKDGITAAVEEMANGASEMASSVQNTASAMMEMGNAIDSITTITEEAAESAGRISAISGKAQDNLKELIDANHSTVNATDAVTKGILEASDAVREISKAAETITGIASQTNLLSLNASIEAARAGEAGRGFAVVASEIQQLADQSNKSAQEIQVIIDDIVNKSEENTRLANKIKESVSNEGNVLKEVDDSFNEVVSCVGDMVTQVNTISNQTETLAKSKDTVIDEISTLSSISEENAASTEETSASTQELGANIENINSYTQDIVASSDSVVKMIDFFS